MVNKLIGVMCLLTLFVTEGYGQNNWPMAAGNKERNSWAMSETELYPPFADPLKLPGAYHVSCMDGVVYQGRYGTPNVFAAVDLETKNELWTFPVPNTASGVGFNPAVGESLVYVGGQNCTGLYALDKVTGMEKWYAPTGSLYGRSPILDEDRLYINGDKFYCLNASTGETIWSQNINKQSAPAVDNETAYVIGNNKCYAFNKITGVELWQVPIDCKTSLAVDDMFLYVRDGNDIKALEKITGSVLWNFPISFNIVSANPASFFSITNDRIYFSLFENSEGKGQLFALNKITGQLIWEKTALDKGTYSPTIANGVIYVTQYKPTYSIYGFDQLSGDSLFYVTASSLKGTPIVANHCLIVPGAYNTFVYQNSPTRVDNRGSEKTPMSPRLEQNYPNPFNNSTIFNYYLPNDSPVKLEIINTRGHVVDVLVDQLSTAGAYSVSWHHAQNPTGVYFYRLGTDHTSITQKCLLIK